MTEDFGCLAMSPTTLRYDDVNVEQSQQQLRSHRLNRIGLLMNLQQLRQTRSSSTLASRLSGGRQLVKDTITNNMSLNADSLTP